MAEQVEVTIRKYTGSQRDNHRGIDLWSREEIVQSWVQGFYPGSPSSEKFVFLNFFSLPRLEFELIWL